MPRVDVVVPCYNYGRFLEQCVGSVLSQSDVSVRVLIIDDASSDDTSEIGRSLATREPRVEYRRHAVNRGHIATYNEGLLQWAGSDYSLLLSADDYLLPGTLARAVAVMDCNPEIGFVFGPAFELRPGDPPPTPLSGEIAEARVIDGIEFIKMSGAHNIVPTATAVVRTKLQKQLGGYRPDLPHAGDMEMWLRFAVNGQVGMLTTPQAVYRRHDSNMSLSFFVDRVLTLPDMRQRALVFATFFAEQAPRLPDLPRLRALTIDALAKEATWQAHAAFEAGQFDVCRELADFAAATCPGVRRTRPWLSLALKRLLGHRAWSTLAPLAARAHNLRQTRAAG
ncbi:glycosyltransferase family 2 protein [Roseomonas xinghualingensis]|uniref:glycosyltransferase family 2 protein n=1 Tax=Roseomonas xinghualingensis TaxID=2986475 RepID=UPI0021F176E5|nr:glycosyltransferase [Roseomonas sp. SXEYE001]MCV4210059.1 glycosyltransferase [Roseomonas sp. SXEYE001]